MTFGDWLKLKRTEKRMSGVELQKRSGISRQYISNLERNLKSDFTGKLVEPSLEAVEALAKGLGVDADEARRVAGYAPKTELPPVPKPIIEALAREGTLHPDDEILIADFITRLKRDK